MAAKAIAREAALVRSLIGSGVTALGQANYADKLGEYYTAFFGVSVGIERLAKLILVVNHALDQREMPTEKIVRQYGHKISDLLDAVEHIAISRGLRIKYTRPRSELSDAIVKCLHEFADASRGRYANFASLGDPQLGEHEPISKWWRDVVELILKHNYYGKRIERDVEARAKLIHDMISPSTLVRHSREDGSELREVVSASVQTGKIAVIQKYGRFNVLVIVRWLADVMCKISNDACVSGISSCCGLEEFFWTYTVDDSFLLTRKRWPLT